MFDLSTSSLYSLYYPLAGAGLLLLAVIAAANQKSRKNIIKLGKYTIVLFLVYIGYLLLSGGYLTPEVKFSEEGQVSKQAGQIYYQDPAESMK